MDKMIAYCGLECKSCPIHLATLTQNLSRQQMMRKSIAEQCSQHYSMDFQPGDINDCDGCKANTGRLFSGCLKCEVRKCAGKKNIENCAFCCDYPCNSLKALFNHDPGAQIRLDEIRNTKKRQRQK
jgi:hypothetical protein